MVGQVGRRSVGSAPQADTELEEINDGSSAFADTHRGTLARLLNEGDRPFKEAALNEERAV
jgi:hypothetical protein